MPASYRRYRHPGAGRRHVDLYRYMTELDSWLKVDCSTKNFETCLAAETIPRGDPRLSLSLPHVTLGRPRTRPIPLIDDDGNAIIDDRTGETKTITHLELIHMRIGQYYLDSGLYRLARNSASLGVCPCCGAEVPCEAVAS